MMKFCICDNGYLKVGLSKPEGVPKTMLVHRVVAEAFLPKGDGYVVNHKDFNPANNCIENLEWCTDSENMMHAYLCGRLATPINNVHSYPHAKLSHDSVREIRERIKGNERHCDIALSYGVCTEVIGRIGRGKSWAQLP